MPQAEMSEVRPAVERLDLRGIIARTHAAACRDVSSLAGPAAQQLRLSACQGGTLYSPQWQPLPSAVPGHADFPQALDSLMLAVVPS